MCDQSCNRCLENPCQKCSEIPIIKCFDCTLWRKALGLSSELGLCARAKGILAIKHSDEGCRFGVIAESY